MNESLTANRNTDLVELRAALQQAQARLHELTAHHRAILDNTAEGIVVIDTEDKITLFNPAAERIFGYAAAEVIGRSSTMFHPPEEIEAILQLLKSSNLPTNMHGLIELTKSRESDWMYLRKDGTRIPGRLSITVLHDTHGQPIGCVGLITDLTDRIRITEVEQREQALIAHISRGTSAAVGERFFNDLTAALRDATGADYVDSYELVTEPDGLYGTLLNTRSVHPAKTRFKLTGSPLECIATERQSIHVLDAQTQFPDRPDLRKWGIRELIGVPLVSSTHAVMGIFFIGHRSQLAESALAERLLEIFAVRASSELERLRNERALQARDAARRWLYAASERIHAQSTVAGVAHEAAAAIAEHGTQPFVAVALTEPEGYRIIGHAGPTGYEPERSLYPLQPGLMRQAMETGHSILIVSDTPAIHADSELAAEMGSHSIKAVAWIALIEHGRDIGLIALSYPDPSALSELDLDNLAMFGRAVTLALGRALHRQELEYQADHDGLTGLFNRTVLHRDFARWREEGGKQTALLLLDLDRFKEVNDTLGHHVGDALLRQIGERLRAGINYSKATLTRLGGDEFAILLRGKKLDAERANTLAENMLKALRRPFRIDNVNLEIGASVGVALYPDHGDDSHALLRSADVAMYEAKRSGGGVAVYNRSLDFNSPERLALISDLGSGIRARELELFYQPKIDLRTRRAVSFEGLLRWRHPRLGLLAPDRFLPLIEMSDAIHDLTEMVLETACAQMQAWMGAGSNVTIAVNLSARNLIDDRAVRHLAGLMRFYQIPAGRLELEITETALIHDPEYALHLLKRIAALGVQLSIDDFGTGYSSLAYLRQMPISALKVDRTFIRDMLTNPQDQLIVRSIVQLAHSLNMKVIAEGVENAEVLARLCEMGCDQAQGFYFTRPLPAAELQQWLTSATVTGFPQPPDSLQRSA